MSNKPQVILLRETYWQSLASDATTFGMLAGFIGLGVLLDSVVMQWVGALMAFFAISVRAVAVRTKTGRMSIPEARARLDEIEAQGGASTAPEAKP